MGGVSVPGWPDFFIRRDVGFKLEPRPRSLRLEPLAWFILPIRDKKRKPPPASFPARVAVSQPAYPWFSWICLSGSTCGLTSCR